jgi:N-acetylneuraminate lyase
MPFRGIYPALTTPLDEQDQLNETALRAILDFQLDAGVHGFWILGGMGEGLLLSTAERERAAEIAVEHVAGRGQVIVHIGAMTTREAAHLAAHAERIGADAIACLPPLYYRPDRQGIIDHYRLVAEASALPLFAYNIPGSTNVTITAELLQELAEQIPTVRGIKHSSFDLYSYQQMRERTAWCDFTLFSGSDEVLLAALSMGGDGAVGSTFNLMPSWFVQLYDAFRQGDLARAQEWQQRINGVIRLLLEVGVLSATKEGMRLLGFDCGVARRPIRPLSAGERETLRAGLAKAGVI